MTKRNKKIKAAEFDQAFEEGKVFGHLDLKSVKRSYPVQRINIDIPRETLEKVDREASRVGVARASLLKLWIAEQADRLAS